MSVEFKLPWTMRPSVFLRRLMIALMLVLLIVVGFVCATASSIAEIEAPIVILVMFEIGFSAILFQYILFTEEGITSKGFIFPAKKIIWNEINKVEYGGGGRSGDQTIRVYRGERVALVIHPSPYDKVDVSDFIYMLEKMAPQAQVDESIKKYKINDERSSKS